MRLISFVTACTLLVIPSFCCAAMYSVTGNKPQSPANYKRWVGLVELVNQPSCQRLVWSNGAETFSYAGDTEALNSAPQLFAKVECPTHTVVSRSGPLFNKYDWEVYISEGIDRAAIEQYDLKLVRDLAPTLVVYVSDKLKLDAVVFPPNVHIQQITDLRSRSLKAQENAESMTGGALQRLMRHRDYSTTQRYIKLAGQLGRAVESLHVPEVFRRKVD